MNYDADIFDAVEFGDLETVKMFWTNEIEVDWQDLSGMNLIMLAATYNHKEIVEYLLSFKPNLHLVNKAGETVLQIAEKYQDKTVYHLLLNKIPTTF